MPKPLQHQLTYRCHLLNKLSDNTSKELYAKECGLSLSEARLLSAVGSFSPLSVNELAFRSNLTKGQASRAAQAMAEKNYLLKMPSKEDARGVQLTLTQKGQSLYDQIMNLVEQRNQEIFSCLNSAELEQLSIMLDRVIEHIR